VHILPDKYFKTLFEWLSRSLLQLLLEHDDFLDIDISQCNVATCFRLVACINTNTTLSQIYH